MRSNGKLKIEQLLQGLKFSLTLAKFLIELRCYTRILTLSLKKIRRCYNLLYTKSSIQSQMISYFRIRQNDQKGEKTLQITQQVKSIQKKKKEFFRTD